MKVEYLYEIYQDKLGNEVVLKPGKFDTRVHCCDGCFYHENKIKCDNALTAKMPECGVTYKYLEAPK